MASSMKGKSSVRVTKPARRKKNPAATRDRQPVATATTRRIRDQLQLTQPTFAKLLPVSVRTLVTLEGGAPPTEAIARRLKETKRLADALAEVIQSESLGTWLQSPNTAFDGLKPIEVIDRGESDRIWAMIHYLRSGTPA